jgi:hypothetical protein
MTELREMSDKPAEDGVTPIATEAGDERFIAPFSDESCFETELRSAESGNRKLANAGFAQSSLPPTHTPTNTEAV